MNTTNPVETVVATVVPEKTSAPEVADAKEKEICDDVALIEKTAVTLVIDNDEAYEKAVELGRTIQTKTGDVKEFFKPMKDAAHQVHKKICEREKLALAPLERAKKVLQNAVGEYQIAVEKKRREAEEKLRLEAQAEAERSLKEAVEAEANGDEDAVQSALMDAQFAESMASSVSVDLATPKVAGCTVSYDYEIVECNPDKVPVKIGETVIRPVDEKAVLKAIREADGKIEIPGIVFKSVPKTSFRRF